MLPDSDAFKMLLNDIRSENEDRLRHVTLGELDEVMVSIRIAGDCYCEFSCGRCPHYKEDYDCNEFIRRCLEYDIYNRLYGKFTMDEFLYIRKAIDCCMSEHMTLEELAETFKEEFDIEVDLDKMANSFKQFGEEDE